MTEASASSTTPQAKKVWDLLVQGTNEKLLVGGLERALPPIEEAFGLAEGLGSPWLEIAAYRLAHLKFRSAKSIEELEEVEQLFSIACGKQRANPFLLGPMPHIFRLAVLHRMGNKEGQEACFKTVVEVVKGLKSASADIDKDEQTEEARRGWLQSEIFNLLEFAAYATGLDYNRIGLEGLKTPFDDLYLLSNAQWEVWGSIPGLGGIRLPRDIAHAELDRLAKKYPEALLFQLPQSPEKAGFKLGSDRGFQPLSNSPDSRPFRLLASMFDRGIRTRDEQRKRVMGEGWDTEDARTNFRTGVIRTLRDKLSELLGNKGDALPPSGPDGQPYKLAPRIKVIGVVHMDTYLNPPDSIT